MRTCAGRLSKVSGCASVALLSWALPLAAQSEQSLLQSDPIQPAARFVVRLHGGDYEIRSSKDDRLHVTASGDLGQHTDVTWRPKPGESRLEIDPPTGHNGPHIILALPACAALDLRLTAGELVLNAVPCEKTEISINAGEVRAELGDADRYRSVHASVSIGEVDAPGLGTSGADVSKGGFFPSFARSGAGPRSFAAHVGTGQITLRGSRQ